MKKGRELQEVTKVVGIHVLPTARLLAAVFRTAVQTSLSKEIPKIAKID